MAKKKTTTKGTKPAPKPDDGDPTAHPRVDPR